VGQVASVILQLWFWVTPIIYHQSALPAYLQGFVAANPLAPLVHAYQEIILFNRLPNWLDLLWPAMLGLCLCLSAFQMFRRASPEMVDVL
jgi:lipopolysaccharide transport system permease protein